MYDCKTIQIILQQTDVGPKLSTKHQPRTVCLIFVWQARVFSVAKKMLSELDFVFSCRFHNWLQMFLEISAIHSTYPLIINKIYKTLRVYCISPRVNFIEVFHSMHCGMYPASRYNRIFNNNFVLSHVHIMQCKKWIQGITYLNTVEMVAFKWGKCRFVPHRYAKERSSVRSAVN